MTRTSQPSAAQPPQMTSKMLNQSQPISQVAFGGVNYGIVPSFQLPSLALLEMPFIALTLFCLQSHTSFDPVRLDQQLQQWLDFDSVFQPTFLKHVVVVHGNDTGLSHSQQVCDYLKGRWNTKSCTILPLGIFPIAPLEGPYFSISNTFHTPYRLYDDVQKAFVMVLLRKSESSDKFENLRLAGEDPTSLSVAVPPRRPAADDRTKPLLGLRFAVKDLFHIHGLRPTVGCRAYYAVADTATKTAPALKTLLDLGASLIGTLKLGSLITKEEPSEAADYQAPFNPRGDGYQSPWSSSSGSGAAIASYEWLDFTLGTDTTGSSRRPALANGCFQLRISHDALSQDGIIHSWLPFDAPSIFTRDLAMLKTVVESWLPVRKEVARKSRKVIYLTDYFPVDDPHQQSLIDKFADDFAEASGVELSKVSLASYWEDENGSEDTERSIQSYLKDVGVNSFCFGLTRELDGFRERYRSQFNKEPYVNPTTRWRLDAAANVSTEQFEDAVERLSEYKNWLLHKVLNIDHSEPFVLIPITTQEPDYRDQAAERPSAPDAFQPLWISPILGAPEISVPIGEISYESRVSMRQEYLPLVMSVIGAPGSDVSLIETIAEVFNHSKRPTKVNTGYRMYD